MDQQVFPSKQLTSLQMSSPCISMQAMPYDFSLIFKRHRRNCYAEYHVFKDRKVFYINRCYQKVQVGKDQEKAQSEKDSHSKNRGGKKPK